MKAITFLALLLVATPSMASPYAWLADWPAAPERTVPLDARFPAPAGFTRVVVAPESFAAWLRGLPLHPERTEVLAYDGRPLSRPAIAIVALDVGRRDVQQCADSILRLHAEYLWSHGQGPRAAYHFTSGDRSTFAAWSKGERFKVKGSKVQRISGGPRGIGHGAYRDWLMHLFTYAGTQSLRLDSDLVGARPYQAGDFFVQPGGPGHAVVILDIAEDTSGRRVALVGQGFMPAEDFHVLQADGPRDLGGVWFALPDDANPWIATPSWAPFHRDQARRFRDVR